MHRNLRKARIRTRLGSCERAPELTMIEHFAQRPSHPSPSRLLSVGDSMSIIQPGYEVIKRIRTHLWHQSFDTGIIPRPICGKLFEHSNEGTTLGYLDDTDVK